jgi:hypothetical protein
VQAVFDAPVLSNHLVEPLRRQGSTEQAVGGLGGGFVPPVVEADHGRLETRTATVSTEIDWLQDNTNGRA